MPDDGRGSQVDVRARRAARRARDVVAQLQAHAPADLERFERLRRRRGRNERYRVLVVAALLAMLVAVVVAGMLPRPTSTPVGPPPLGNGLIVFGRSGAGLDQRSLFTIAPDGSNEQRLPITYTDCGEWSPDGSRLHVTASEYPGAPLRPAVVNPDGSGFTLFDTNTRKDLNLGCGGWSPDGTRLVLEGFGQRSATAGIYVVGLSDGSGITRLTHGHDIVPQYAPDGSAVIFQRAARDGPAALFVIGSDGSGLRRITPWGTAASAGSWSRDGHIVFAGPRDMLWTVRFDGTERTRVPVDLGGRVYQPRWSPDGTTIVFGLQVSGQTDIYTVHPDGSGLTQLTHTRDVDELWPDWSVG
jgi:Tol biopolymer transport system component